MRAYLADTSFSSVDSLFSEKLKLALLPVDYEKLQDSHIRKPQI